jgi:uncharacterized protein YaaN involved in tellurite resistance
MSSTMSGEPSTPAIVTPTSAPVATSESLMPELAKTELVAYHQADPSKKARLDTLLAQIDFKDSNSILFFGTKAQEQLTLVSDSMLEGVRNKDVGPAGGALNEMLVTLRGFSIDEDDLSEEPSWLAKIFGAGKPILKFLQRYEEVRKQIDIISDKLDSHKTRLLTDIASLDRLYAANLDYFHVLAEYIAAGDEKLRQLDQDVIPAREREAQASGDVLKAQELRDLRATRDDLERRVHDLKLTRQVAMQSLPSIRLVQENDKALVGKISSTLVNTVPLWRQQLAQAVTIYRSREAGKTLKEATDLTNDLLLANAENLRQANAEVRSQIERGVFDIEAVKKANDLLIATIEDSLQIADEGKRKRIEAENQLQLCEGQLREVLVAARSRTPAPVRPGA